VEREEVEREKRDRIFKTLRTNILTNIREAQQQQLLQSQVEL